MRKFFFLAWLTIASLPVFAVDYDTVIDNLYYKFSGSTATIVGCRDIKYWSNAHEVPYESGYGTYWTADLIIPETVTYNSRTYTVTVIGKEAFQHKSYLHSVVIPPTVTQIDEAAFAWTYAESINIPDGITSLNKHSFAGLKITSLTLPSTLNYIGEGALQECHQLQNLTIPDNVTRIDKQALAYCESLISVQLPANLHYIEERAFVNSGIQQINIPEDVWSIGDYAFCYTQLKNISLTHTDCSLGEYVFYETPMESAILATTGKYMFGGLNNTQSKTQNLSITLLDGLTWISPYAFCNTDIQTITIPASVIALGEGAFTGCIDLQSITFTGNSTEEFPTQLFRGCSALSEISIPEGIRIIGEGVFAGCNLQKILIPSTLDSIGAYNFGYSYEYGSYDYHTEEQNFEVHIANLSRWLNINFAREDYGALKGSNPLSLSENLYVNNERLPEVLVVPTDVYNLHFDVLGLSIRNTIGIDIPSSVEGVYAGIYSNNPKWLRVGHSTPPTLNEYNFYGTTLLVPCGSIRAYRDADNWKEFGEIWDIPYYYEINVNKDFIVDDYYDLGYISIVQKPTCANDATLIVEAYPRDGYHFDRWSDGNTDNPHTIQLTDHTYLTAEFAEGETGLEEIVMTTDRPCKVLNDGILYIIRPDGTIFNAQGAEVK